MGEIADAMIGGEMCAMCGVYLEGEPWGFPCYCSKQCVKDAGLKPEEATIKPEASYE